MRIAYSIALIMFGAVVAFTAAQAQRAGRDAPSKKDDIPSSSRVTSVGGKNLSYWRAELKNRDPSKRAMAIVAIIQFGDAASVCVPDLIDRTQDNDVSPRAKALLALRLIRVDDKDIPRVVRAVAERLDRSRRPAETQAVIRYEAAMTLHRFVKHADPAIPALISGMQDPASWEIRHTCVSLLWRVAADNKDGPDARVVQAMLDRLYNPKSPGSTEGTYAVRLELLQGLGAMGRPADPTLAARLNHDLKTYTMSSNKALAVWAYAALVSHNEGNVGESALVSITRLLNNSEVEIRSQAAHALGALGTRAKSKVPNLLKMLKDPEAVAVHAACSALANVADNKDDNVVDALLAVAQHKDHNRAGSAVIALFHMKATFPRVLRVFDKLREDKELHLGLRQVIENGLDEMKKPK